MKRFILVLFITIISFTTSASCQKKTVTYLGSKEMGVISAFTLSINNNGDKAIVEFREDKGLWIIGKDFGKKIADAPATMGTWSPSNQLIAYINGKKLILADSNGRISKELNLGLRWVDSMAWLKNEKEIYMFEGPEEFEYRLIKINLVTGEIKNVLPQSSERLQLRVNKANENELYFMNNRYPKEIPEICGLGKYNTQTKNSSPELYDKDKYRVVYYDILPGDYAIFPDVWSKNRRSHIALLDIKKKKIKITNIECNYNITSNYVGTKIASILEDDTKGLVEVIDVSMLK